MNLSKKSILGLTFAAVVGVTASGCAVVREQQTVGSYVNDAGITTCVKTKHVEDKSVDASAISVETLSGEVMLSGFAKNATEKSRAETLAMSCKGVSKVRNSIAVKP